MLNQEATETCNRVLSKRVMIFNNASDEVIKEMSKLVGLSKGKIKLIDIKTSLGDMPEKSNAGRSKAIKFVGNFKIFEKELLQLRKWLTKK